MEIILFTAPVSCAKVPLILLEEIGSPFETRLVRFMKGEHKSPEFKRYNPKGKVPAIVIDGEALPQRRDGRAGRRRRQPGRAHA